MKLQSLPTLNRNYKVARKRYQQSHTVSLRKGDERSCGLYSPVSLNIPSFYAILQHNIQSKILFQKKKGFNSMLQ